MPIPWYAYEPLDAYEEREEKENQAALNPPPAPAQPQYPRDEYSRPAAPVPMTGGYVRPNITSPQGERPWWLPPSPLPGLAEQIDQINAERFGMQPLQDPLWLQNLRRSYEENRGVPFAPRIGAAIGGERGREIGQGVQDVLNTIGTASRQGIAAPALGYLLQQNPAYRLAAAAMPDTLPQPTQPFNPANLIGGGMPGAVLKTSRDLAMGAYDAAARSAGQDTPVGQALNTLIPGLYSPANQRMAEQLRGEREANMQFEQSLPQGMRLLGETVLDPFGLPVNLAVNALAAFIGIPLPFLTLYNMADKMDWIANIASATPDEMVSMATIGAGMRGAAHFAPRIMEALQAYGRMKSGKVTDEEIGRAIGGAMWRADAEQAAREGRTMARSVPVYDLKSKQWVDMPIDEYYGEMVTGGLKREFREAERSAFKGDVQPPVKEPGVVDAGPTKDVYGKKTVGDLWRDWLTQKLDAARAEWTANPERGSISLDPTQRAAKNSEITAKVPQEQFKPLTRGNPLGSSLNKGRLVNLTWQGKPAWSDGSMMAVGEHPFKTVTVGIEDLSPAKEKQFHDSMLPSAEAAVEAVPVLTKASSEGGVWSSTRKGAVVLATAEGRWRAVQGAYYGYFKKTYPNATFHMGESEESPVFVKDGGEIVGVIMPLSKRSISEQVEELDQYVNQLAGIEPTTPTGPATLGASEDVSLAAYKRSLENESKRLEQEAARADTPEGRAKAAEWDKAQAAVQAEAEARVGQVQEENEALDRAEAQATPKDIRDEAERWLVATRQAAREMRRLRESQVAEAIERTTQAVDLADYLKKRFGLPETVAREVANGVFSRRFPTVGATVADFADEPWAKAAVKASGIEGVEPKRPAAATERAPREAVSVPEPGPDYVQQAEALKGKDYDAFMTFVNRLTDAQLADLKYAMKGGTQDFYIAQALDERFAQSGTDRSRRDWELSLMSEASRQPAPAAKPAKAAPTGEAAMLDAIEQAIQREFRNSPNRTSLEQYAREFSHAMLAGETRRPKTPSDITVNESRDLVDQMARITDKVRAVLHARDDARHAEIEARKDDLGFVERAFEIKENKAAMQAYLKTLTDKQVLQVQAEMVGGRYNPWVSREVLDRFNAAKPKMVYTATLAEWKRATLQDNLASLAPTKNAPAGVAETEEEIEEFSGPIKGEGYEITPKSAQGGIEIRFDAKPPQAVLDIIKTQGFRWSKANKVWWAKAPKYEIERGALVRGVQRDIERTLPARQVLSSGAETVAPKPETPATMEVRGEAAPAIAPQGTAVAPEQEVTHGDLSATERPGQRADTEGAGERVPGTLEATPAQDVSRDEGGGRPRKGVSPQGRSDANDVPQPERPDGGSSGVVRGVAGDRVQPLATKHITRHEPAVGGHDYIITPSDAVGEGGAKAKFRANVEAIRLIRRLMAESRLATPEEQAKLVKYVGWGDTGFSVPFGRSYEGTYYDLDNAKRQGWGDEYAELRELMTEEEFLAASRSRLNAHYTSPSIIRAVWTGLERLGLGNLDHLRVLEPAAGVGHFYGLMPPGLAARASRSAVELDLLTGNILKQLYQNADVHIKGYEAVPFAKNAFDVAVSNVPFAKDGFVLDEWQRGPNKWLNKLALHNQFFVRGLEHVRPGGVVAFITTHFTLDAKNATRLRQYLADQADLLGAIRLPKTAFKANAGTEVVTDILFLRKRAPGETPSGIAWTKVDRVDAAGAQGPHQEYVGYRRGQNQYETVDDRPYVNEYFIQHPEMVLGKHSMTGSMYGSNEYTVEPIKDADLDRQVVEAISRLPADIITSTTGGDRPTNVVEVAPNMREGSLTLQDDKVMVYREGELVPFVARYATDLQRVRGYIQIRDLARDVNRVQLSGEVGTPWRQAVDALNKAYDAFVREFGPVRYRNNASLLRIDPSQPFVFGLENSGADLMEEIMAVAKSGKSLDWSKLTDEHLNKLKTDFFRKPLVRTSDPVSSADTPKDALLVSLNEHGRVDLERIAQLLNIAPEQAKDALRGLVYTDPTTNELVDADAYLSGDIREKIAAAKEAMERDPMFADNVAALEAVLPEDLPPSAISVRPGVPWIGETEISQFTDWLTGMGGWKWKHLPALGEWRLTTAFKPWQNNARVYQQYGTPRMGAHEILDRVLNNKEILINARLPDGKTVVDGLATAQAREKAQAIVKAFRDWVWKDDDRAKRLVREYNDRFNSNRIRRFDGSHLQLPGMSRNISLMPHQKNAIWRVLSSGNTLLAHEVGAGKTYEMIAAGMELRRLGLSRRNVFVVLNYQVDAFATEFMTLYPGANILVPNKEDYSKEGRNTLFARILSGDWDGIIVPMSQFTKLSVRPETYERYASEYLTELREVLMSGELDNRTQKQIEKELDKAEQQIELAIAELRARQDEVVFWEDLGIDALFVDEADNFKNLQFATSMGRIKGLPNAKSQRAFDMYIKVRELSQRNGGRGVVFATGTPIANTIAECWTMMRYLMGDTLKAKELHRFDVWAQMFAEQTTGVQLTATGRYEPVTALNTFVNVPELSSMFQSVADIVMSEDVPGLEKLKPKLITGKRIPIVTQASSALKQYIGTLADRMDDIRKGDVDPTEDNALKVYSDAAKASLDMRLIDPTLPREEGGKIERLIQQIKADYDETMEDKGAQLVFIDLSTPKSDKELSAAQEARAAKEAEKLDDSDDFLAAGPPGGEAYQDNEVESAEEAAWRSTVYAEVKAGLMEAGIPEKEIAFIHDAKTDKAKQHLFESVNEGRVRVLLGSTGKMGAGMNVQKRLRALHHVTTPWRPRDIEQREGRILRQGNEVYGPKLDPATKEVLDEGRGVKVYQYLTEGSFDGVVWQLIESKWRYIKAMLRRDVTVRTVKDMDSDIMDANMMKSLSTGNELAFERAVIENQLIQARMKQSDWLDARVKGKAELEAIPKQIKGAQDKIAQAESDQKVIAKASDKTIEIGGKRLSLDKDHAEASLDALQEALQKAVHELVPEPLGAERHIGRYRGMDMKVRFLPKYPGAQISLSNPDAKVRGVAYATTIIDVLPGSFKVQGAPRGLLTRLNNVADKQPQETVKMLQGVIRDLEQQKTNWQEIMKQGDPTEGEVDYLMEQAGIIDEALKADKAKLEDVPELLGLRAKWDIEKARRAAEPPAEAAPAEAPAEVAPAEAEAEPPAEAAPRETQAPTPKPAEAEAPKVYEPQRTPSDVNKPIPGRPFSYLGLATGYVDTVRDSLPLDQQLWLNRMTEDELQDAIKGIATRYQDATLDETQAIINQLYSEAAQRAATAAEPTPQGAAEAEADALVKQAEAQGPAELPETPDVPVVETAPQPEPQAAPEPKPAASAPIETHDEANNVHGRVNDQGEMEVGHKVKRGGQDVFKPDLAVTRQEWERLQSEREKLEFLKIKLGAVMEPKLRNYRTSLDFLSGRLRDAGNFIQRDIVTKRQALDNAKGRLTEAMRQALEQRQALVEQGTQRLGEAAEAAKTTASVKIMLTKQDEADLRGLGYTQEQINKMTPDEAAWRIHDQVAAQDVLAGQPPAPAAPTPTAPAPAAPTPPQGTAVTPAPKVSAQPPTPPPPPATPPPTPPVTGGPPAVIPPTPPQGPAGGTPPAGAPIDPEEQLRLLQAATARDKLDPKARFRARVQKLARQVYDRIYPIHEVSKAVGSDAYAKARVVSGMTMAGESLLIEHVYPVLDSVGKDIKGLEDYMIAMRMKDALAINPNAKLAGGVVDPAAALQALKASMSPERFKKIEDAAEQLWKLNDQLVLTPALNNGRLSLEGYDAMLDRWPHYIPFYRQGFEDWEAHMRPPTGQPANMGAAFSKVIDEEGSLRRLDEPLSAWMAQVIRTQVENARNDAAKALVEALEDFSAQTNETLVVRDSMGPMGADVGTISYWEDGNRVTVRVPKLYADAAKQLEAEPANALISILRKLAQPLRLGATSANPSFLVVNPLRDSMTAWFQEGLVPFSKDWVAGWAAAFGRDATWHEAARAGIFMSGMSDTSRHTDTLGRTRALGAPLGIPARNLGDVLLWLPRAVMELNERMEQATRIGVWVHLRDLPEWERILRTRDATVDFNKAGTVLRLLGQVKPFINVPVQAGANIIKLAKNNPRAALLRAAPFVLVSLLAWVWNQHFQTHDQIPDYEYANNWVFQVGEGQEADGKRFPIYIKIPKGDVVQAVTAVPEALMRIAWRADDRSAVEHLLSAGRTVIGAMSPVEASPADLVTPGASTALELAINKNLYTGRDIVPQYEQSRPPEYQYDARTPVVAVALGQLFNVSPRLIAHAIRGVGGQGAEFYAETLPGVGLRALGYNPVAPGGVNRQDLSLAERISELPIVYRFVGTRRNELTRQGYRSLDKEVAWARRELYKNDEFRRFGLGVNPPGDTYTVNGQTIEVSPEQRAAILRAYTPLLRSALDELSRQDYYLAASENEKRRMIETLRTKVQDNAKRSVLEGGIAWSDEDMPRLVQALGEYREYNALPMYLGLTEEQEALIRMANSRVTAIRRANPNIPLAQARLMAAQENPDGVRLAMIASKMRNPGRQSYWASHPLLSVYFGNLTLEDLGELGLAA